MSAHVPLPDLSVVYVVPLRCVCEALPIRRWLDGLVTARAIRGVRVAASPMPGGGVLVAITVAHPEPGTRALLEAVLPTTTVRVLVYAQLCAAGRASVADLERALSLPEADVAHELTALEHLGLVGVGDGGWTARTWTRGGRA